MANVNQSLSKDATDERHDTKKYGAHARMLTRAKRPGDAKVVRGIQRDEQRHAGLVGRMSHR